eukprot:5791406-Pleurochrysis_carterae.AAC.1
MSCKKVSPEEMSSHSRPGVATTIGGWPLQKYAHAHAHAHEQAHRGRAGGRRVRGAQWCR